MVQCGAGSWEGRPVAVKVMCHEGSATDRLNGLHESLVAQQMKHNNVVRILKQTTQFAYPPFAKVN